MAAWTTTEHRIAMTKPSREAAKLLNRSPEAIRKYRSRNGIVATYIRMPQADLDRIVELRAKNLSWRVIGDMVGRSAPTVRKAYYRLRKKGVVACASSPSESASSSG
jgi:hypothetical protein